MKTDNENTTAVYTIKRYGCFVREITRNGDVLMEWLKSNVIPPEDMQNNEGGFLGSVTPEEIISIATEKGYIFE